MCDTPKLPEPHIMSCAIKLEVQEVSIYLDIIRFLRLTMMQVQDHTVETSLLSLEVISGDLVTVQPPTHIEVPTEEHQVIEVQEIPNDVISQEIQDKGSEPETQTNCEKPTVAFWICCFIVVLVPIWVSLVLADIGIYIGCRIAYTITHWLGSTCIAVSDGRNGDARTSSKCVDEICTVLSCIIGVALYVTAAVTFATAKLAIKALPYILPYDDLCEWIEAHDERFEWMDPRVDS
jgi:hypothetical protein